MSSDDTDKDGKYEIEGNEKLPPMKKVRPYTSGIYRGVWMGKLRYICGECGRAYAKYSWALTCRHGKYGKSRGQTKIKDWEDVKARIDGENRDN